MLNQHEVGALGQASLGANRVDEVGLGLGGEELEGQVDTVGLDDHAGVAKRQALLVGRADQGDLGGLLPAQVVLVHVGGPSRGVHPPHYGCGPHHLPIW